jgi:hypothetical protein
VSVGLHFHWSRYYPRWSARHEKYADGSQSWILQAWWPLVSLSISGHG